MRWESNVCDTFNEIKFLYRKFMLDHHRARAKPILIYQKMPYQKQDSQPQHVSYPD